MSKDEKYNGWTNYETWFMNLNLTNEESLYNEIHEIAKSESDIYKLGDQLKQFVDEFFYVEEYSIYKICDVWTERDFNEINWFEIARVLRSDLDETTN